MCTVSELRGSSVLYVFKFFFLSIKLLQFNFSIHAMPSPNIMHGSWSIGLFPYHPWSSWYVNFYLFYFSFRGRICQSFRCVSLSSATLSCPYQKWVLLNINHLACDHDFTCNYVEHKSKEWTMKTVPSWQWTILALRPLSGAICSQSMLALSRLVCHLIGAFGAFGNDLYQIVFYSFM